MLSGKQLGGDGGMGVVYTVVMEPIVTRNPNVMHGTPCFAGTRVTVQTFFDHLEAGYTIEQFLEQFPTVRREQVVRLLALLREDVAGVAVSGAAAGL